MPDMDDDTKKRYMGMCNFLLLFTFSTAAFICTITSTGYCAFVSRNIVLSEPASTVCEGYEGETMQCETFLQNHGVGFWGWQSTVPENQIVCLSYTQFVPGTGYVTPTFDTKFNASKGFTIVASFFGMLAFLTLAVSSCCPLDQGRMKCMSIYFFFAFFFQALVFIIMRSSICDKGFFEVYFVDDSAGDSITSVSCGLSTGSSLAVAATVLYFVCMVMAPAAMPPEPISFGGGGE